MERCNEAKRQIKRKFSEAWLSDDRYKHCIRSVESDDTIFYCNICNKTFSCSSHVSRHMDSACHRNNIKENLLDNNKNENENRMDENKNDKCKRKFRRQWVDIDDFKLWLRESPNEAYSFYCLICDRSYIGGLSEIYRHAESKVHTNKCRKSDSEAKKSNEHMSSQNDESRLTFDERKKSAEIRFAALISEKNIPHQTATEILKLFQDIAKDPHVLNSMSMGRTKCKNIISNVLGPIETERVVCNIQTTKFSVFIDETSDITNEKWMTFLARYVDSENLDIRSQLVKIINIDATDCSAEKLFNAFQSEMHKLQIPFVNIIALSCDNASVMIGKHLSFKKKLEEKCKNLLTIACPCHSAALAAHVACDKMPEYCEEFLKKIAKYINSSPKRSAIFNEFSETFQNTHNKILKFCNTRWLSYHQCVDRLLKSWNTIIHFLNVMIINDNTQSVQYLLSIMTNVDTKAYFLFLKYVLNMFNSFNAFFQAIETRIHFLQPKSMKFLMQICQNFLRSELLDNLQDISFHEKNNHKSLCDINLGSECEEYLRDLIKEGHANVITIIRQNCLQFYVTAAEEIRKRLPVYNLFLSKLQVFETQIALFDSNREISFNDVSFIAKTLGEFNEYGLKEEWFALHSHLMIEEKQYLSSLNFDEMWKNILKRQCNNICKYPNLKSLINAIRSLPHSNADPERAFSVLTDLKSKKRSSLSSTTINATCVFKSALKTRKETALNMEINKKHLHLMSADTLYTSVVKEPKNNITLYAADSDEIPGSSSYNNTQ